MRNSSLVEWSCADNVTGLKSRAEAADSILLYGDYGVVAERRSRSEAEGITHRGAWSSANVGMSSERGVRISSAGCPRVPGEGSSSQG